MKPLSSIVDFRERLERARAAAAGLPPPEPVTLPLAVLQDDARIPERYRDARLDTVPFADKLRAWAKEPRGRAAYLFGLAGRGKTYSTCGLANEILEAGGTVRFVSALSIAEEARANYGRDRGVFEFALWARLLILDDLGAEFLDGGRRDAGQRHVAELLHGRYDATRPTAITTNLSPKELAEHDARLASRLLGGALVIPVTGPDRRFEGQK